MTQIFPRLIPVRRKVQCFFYYAKMYFDKNHYSDTRIFTHLPHKLFETSCSMYNENTGFDMVYQRNKVFNLKLAAKKLNRLLIKPGEIFSFWQIVRYADKVTPYKEGLTVTNGKLGTARGGGLCQMSNLLFCLFLHTPLTITERNGHEIKEFPEPNSLKGVDATVYEGWLDLKVRNDTESIYQITVTFEDENIIGTINVDKKPEVLYKATNGKIEYTEENGKIYEIVTVERTEIYAKTGETAANKRLYTNMCEIRYPLPVGTNILRKEPI